MQIIKTKDIEDYEYLNAKELFRDILTQLSQFKRWLETRIERHGFQNSIDFYVIKETSKLTGRNSTQFYISYRMAVILLNEFDNTLAEKLKSYLYNLRKPFRTELSENNKVSIDKDNKFNIQSNNFIYICSDVAKLIRDNCYDDLEYSIKNNVLKISVRK